LTCHREPPLGGVAIQGRKLGAAALDCFVAALLAMTVGQCPWGNAHGAMPVGQCPWDNDGGRSGRVGHFAGWYKTAQVLHEN
jgi:hypothetical protein